MRTPYDGRYRPLTGKSDIRDKVAEIMQFGDLTYEEIRAVAEDSVAIVPLGCTEQQGPHLPVDFDTWIVGRMCAAASEWAAETGGVQSLVLPTLPFGPTPEHHSFGSGFVDLPQRLHEEVVAAVLESLAAQGFRRILIWRGCGQHDVSKVVDTFNKDHFGDAWAYQPTLPYSAIWGRVGDLIVSSGHADAFATSIALYLRSDHVRADLIWDPVSTPPDWSSSNLDFGNYSKTGVIGDPTPASYDLGERLWAEIVPAVGREVIQVGTVEANGLNAASAD